jgi:hypothetical protein
MYQAEELKKRTKQFAIRIVKLFRSLPRSEEARIIGRQMLRSGTSVLWLELLVDTEIVRAGRMSKLIAEANELLAIFAASQRTARARRSLSQ